MYTNHLEKKMHLISTKQFPSNIKKKSYKEKSSAHISNFAWSGSKENSALEIRGVNPWDIQLP